MSLTTGYVVIPGVNFPKHSRCLSFCFLPRVCSVYSTSNCSPMVLRSQHDQEMGHISQGFLGCSAGVGQVNDLTGQAKNPSIPSRPNQDGRVQLHLVVCLRLVRRCATVWWAGRGNTARTSEFRGTHISQSETAAALLSTLPCPALLCTSVIEDCLPTHLSRSSRAATSCCRGPATRLGMAV